MWQPEPPCRVKLLVACPTHSETPVPAGQGSESPLPVGKVLRAEGRAAQLIQVGNRGSSSLGAGAAVPLPAVARTQLRAGATSAGSRPPTPAHDTPRHRSWKGIRCLDVSFQSDPHTSSYTQEHPMEGGRPDSLSPRVAGVGADAAAGAVANVTPHFLRIPASRGGAASGQGRGAPPSCAAAGDPSRPPLPHLTKVTLCVAHRRLPPPRGASLPHRCLTGVHLTFIMNSVLPGVWKLDSHPQGHPPRPHPHRPDSWGGSRVGSSRGDPSSGGRRPESLCDLTQEPSGIPGRGPGSLGAWRWAVSALPRRGLPLAQCAQVQRERHS